MLLFPMLTLQRSCDGGSLGVDEFQWNCSKVLIVYAYLYGKTGRFGAGTVDLVHQLLAVHFLRSPEEAGHCEAQGKARALI
jgi:hypothetical protein